jgi:stearoyl-CoA desaturase (delta-9 desaturase)
VDDQDIKKYCPDITTDDDWMQRVLVEKYRHLGPWVWHIVSLMLFGPVGFILSLIARYTTKDWLGVFLGNYANHKYGFEYAGHRHPTDRSKNMMPWGLFMAGEELHNNHHNYPLDPSFARYWFEFDLGYAYAKILSYMGLLKIKREMK